MLVYFQRVKPIAQKPTGVLRMLLPSHNASQTGSKCEMCKQGSFIAPVRNTSKGILRRRFGEAKGWRWRNEKSRSAALNAETYYWGTTEKDEDGEPVRAGAPVGSIPRIGSFRGLRERREIPDGTDLSAASCQ
jgi:hypothetical protein